MWPASVSGCGSRGHSEPAERHGRAPRSRRGELAWPWLAQPVTPPMSAAAGVLKFRTWTPGWVHRDPRHPGARLVDLSQIGAGLLVPEAAARRQRGLRHDHVHLADRHPAPGRCARWVEKLSVSLV